MQPKGNLPMFICLHCDHAHIITGTKSVGSVKEIIKHEQTAEEGAGAFEVLDAANAIFGIGRDEFRETITQLKAAGEIVEREDMKYRVPEE